MRSMTHPAAAIAYTDAFRAGEEGLTLLHEIAHHARWYPDLEATREDLAHYDARSNVNGILDLGQIYDAISACDAAGRRLFQAAISAE